MILKLNSTIIKTPNRPNGKGFRIERFEISEATRVASGKMTKDIIAVKWKFYLEYSFITATDKTTILDILTNGDSFFEFKYEDEGVEKTHTVYAGSISLTPFKTRAIDGYIWVDFAVNLIEQ